MSTKAIKLKQQPKTKPLHFAEREPEELDNPGGSDPDNPGDRQDFSPDLDEEGLDPVHELFDEPDAQKVQLFRQEPVIYQNQKISGFIMNLPTYADLGWIAEQFGGGRYLLKLVVNARYKKTRVVEIAGQPRFHPSLAAPDGQAAEPNPQPPIKPIQPATGRMINGIPIDTDDESFIRMAQRMAMLNHFFPPPKDINDTLLQMVLSKNKEDDVETLLEKLDKLKSLAQALTPEATGESDGTGGIIGQVIGVIGEMVKHQAGQQPARRVAIPEKTTETVVENSVESPRIEAIEEIKNVPNVREIAQQGATYIVNAFMAEPPVSEQECADLILHQLGPFTPEIKAEIIKGRGPLTNLAKLILLENYDVDSDTVKIFLLYFEKVFAIITAETVA